VIELPENIQSDINLINAVAEEMQMDLYVVGGLPRDLSFGIEITEDTDLDVTEANGNAFDLAFFVSAKYDLMDPIIYESSGTALVVMKSGRFVEFHNAFYNVPHIIDQLYALKVKPTAINKDIYSRDFTINGLLLDPKTNEIIDLTGQGLPDIEKRVLRTAIDPNKILTFNSKNILRGIRFIVQFGLTPVPEYIEAVNNHLPTLIESLKVDTNSKMVQKTVDKTISLNKEKAMELYKEYGLLPYLPPSMEIQREQTKDILGLEVVAQIQQQEPQSHLSMQDRLMMDRQKHKEYIYRKKREKRKDRKNSWDIMKKIRNDYYFNNKGKNDNKNTVKDRKIRVFDYIKNHAYSQLKQPDIVQVVSEETGIPYEKCKKLYIWVSQYDPSVIENTEDKMKAVLNDINSKGGLPSDEINGESIQLLNKFLSSLEKSRQDMIFIKDHFVDAIEENKEEVLPMASSTRFFKYSINHHNYFSGIEGDPIARENAVLRELQYGIEMGIPHSLNWETIRYNLPDEIKLDTLQDLWREQPIKAKEYIEKDLDDKVNRKIESYLSSRIKKYAENTQYGDVPTERIPKGTFDYSDLVQVWGLAADTAIELVNQYSPGTLDKIRYITITPESNVAGVFESDFNDKIKQHDELNERQGIGFRISPSKINNDVKDLTSDMQDEEMKQIVLSVVIAEIIVHEATHANGADDEGLPVQNERNFLTKAITDINSWRENQGLEQIALSLK